MESENRKCSIFKIYGVLGALIEVCMFAGIAYCVREFGITSLQKMDAVTYYWLTFITLVGFWELIYITCHKKTIEIAQELLETKTKVWTNKYGLSMLLPWNFSKLFYAEYAAYADREYMSTKDKWSVLVEGSHATFCALFAMVSLGVYYHSEKSFDASLAFAMGSQFMNSLLYMGEYFIQVKDENSVNFNTPSFPTGWALTKRFFMWINVFWLVMPVYVMHRFFL